jgi:hypothetical protein
MIAQRKKQTAIFISAYLTADLLYLSISSSAFCLLSAS